MSYHSRQPVTYVVSSSAPAQSHMPSRSHHATSHSGRSRSGSHSSSSHYGQPTYHYNTGRRASVSGSGRPPTVYYVQNTRSREYEEPRHHRSNAVYYVPTTSGSSRHPHREYETYDAGRDRHHHQDRHHNEHRGREREHVTYGNPGRRRHSHSEGGHVSAFQFAALSPLTIHSLTFVASSE